jgi:hypothetical protein
MARGRPKGSKSQTTDAYAKRTRALKRKYGADIFKKWGSKGGNPLLLEQSKKKKK